MVHKPYKRVLSVVFVLVCLVCCFAVPASALSPSVNPEDSSVKVYPFVNGSMFYTVAQDYDAESLFGSSYGLAQFIDPIYSSYTGSFAYIYSQIHDIEESGPEDWIISQHVYTANDSNTSYKRLHEVYSVRDNDNITDEYFPWSVTIQLEDFGGVWNRTLLNKMFYLHGQYTFVVEVDVWVIGDNGELLSQHFSLNGSASGAQSILYGSFLQNIEASLGVSEGDPYVMSLNLSIPFGRQSQDLHISRLGSTVQTFYASGSNDPTAIYVKAPFHRSGDPFRPYWKAFLSNSNLVTGEPEPLPPGSGDTVVLKPGDISEFVANSAGGILDAEIFGTFSFGDLLGIFIAVGVVCWLLKVFAGG